METRPGGRHPRVRSFEFPAAGAADEVGAALQSRRLTARARPRAAPPAPVGPSAAPGGRAGPRLRRRVRGGSPPARDERCVDSGLAGSTACSGETRSLRALEERLLLNRPGNAEQVMATAPSPSLCHHLVAGSGTSGQNLLARQSDRRNRQAAAAGSSRAGDDASGRRRRAGQPRPSVTRVPFGPTVTASTTGRLALRRWSAHHALLTVNQTILPSGPASLTPCSSLSGDQLHPAAGDRHNAVVAKGRQRRTAVPYLDQQAFRLDLDRQLHLAASVHSRRPAKSPLGRRCV